jgi:HAD superfamily hydrolase (TIGR01490 family)
MAEYRAGRLDIHEFMAFGLRPLRDNPLEQLESWRARYLAEAVRPRITQAARDLLARHRDAGHTLAVITATNSFIAGPVTDELGVPHLIATEPEQADGRFTGRVAGPACFREGKVEKLEAWLAARGAEARETWFYSDSHNDLPLLTRVDHPTAVNPDAALAEIARARGWPVLTLRRSPEASAA